jgi:TnpA family transposase
VGGKSHGGKEDNYMLNKFLKRKMQKGLNKEEAMNELGRAIFFGK